MSFNIPTCQQHLWEKTSSNTKAVVFVIHWSLLAQTINILDARGFHEAHNNFDNQLQMLICSPVSTRLMRISLRCNWEPFWNKIEDKVQLMLLWIVWVLSGVWGTGFKCSNVFEKPVLKVHIEILRPSLVRPASSSSSSSPPRFSTVWKHCHY